MRYKYIDILLQLLLTKVEYKKQKYTSDFCKNYKIIVYLSEKTL